MLIEANPEAAAGRSRTRVPYNEKLAGRKAGRFCFLRHNDFTVILNLGQDPLVNGRCRFGWRGGS